MAVDLGDYNTVAERIAEFREKHPKGCLRPVDITKPYEVREVAGKTYIVYVAAAYRDPFDTMPGIGIAWEPFPGSTSFTRDSELMNAETSAWGRAIIAVLAADVRKGIASQDEVRRRREEEAERERARTQQPPPVIGLAWIERLAATRTKGEVRKVWQDAAAEELLGLRIAAEPNARRFAELLTDAAHDRPESLPVQDVELPDAVDVEACPAECNEGHTYGERCMATVAQGAIQDVEVKPDARPES